MDLGKKPYTIDSSPSSTPYLDVSHEVKNIIGVGLSGLNPPVSPYRWNVRTIFPQALMVLIARAMAPYCLRCDTFPIIKGDASDDSEASLAIRDLLGDVAYPISHD